MIGSGGGYHCFALCDESSAILFTLIGNFLDGRNVTRDVYPSPASAEEVFVAK